MSGFDVRPVNDEPCVRRTLARAREVFSRRPPPYEVGFCAHCHDPREMRRFLQRSPETLSGAELERVVEDAFYTWGDWPSLAYYVPRLLELDAANSLGADHFLDKLLWAARPRVGNRDDLESIGEPMTDEERGAVFDVMVSIATADLWNPAPDAATWRMHLLVSFLSAFDSPIAPMLEAWKATDEPTAHARFCLFLAEFAPDYAPGCTEFARLVLPENLDALAALTDPALVAEYLAENAGCAARFGADCEARIGKAFDWAATQLARRRMRLRW